MRYHLHVALTYKRAWPLWALTLANGLYVLGHAVAWLVTYSRLT